MIIQGLCLMQSIHHAKEYRKSLNKCPGHLFNFPTSYMGIYSKEAFI